MTEVLVAIGALIIAAIAGFAARWQMERTRQMQAERERGRCYDDARRKAKEAADAIRDAHPDDAAARLSGMAEYVLGHGATTGDAHGETEPDD